MKERVGKIQRGVLRAFAAPNGVPLRTRDLLLCAYPRLESYRHDQYRATLSGGTKICGQTRQARSSDHLGTVALVSSADPNIFA